MKKFILHLLLAYTLLSIIIVGSLIVWEKHDSRNRWYPRKTVYAVNMSNDTVSVHISGHYTRAEKQQLKGKPDTDKILSNTETLPYQSGIGARCQAVAFPLPIKEDEHNELPVDFSIEIKSRNKLISFDREDFYALTGGNCSFNSWTFYITPSLFDRSPVFKVNGVYYKPITGTNDVEVTCLYRSYSGNVIVQNLTPSPFQAR